MFFTHEILSIVGRLNNFLGKTCCGTTLVEMSWYFCLCASLPKFPPFLQLWGLLAQNDSNMGKLHVNQSTGSFGKLGYWEGCDKELIAPIMENQLFTSWFSLAPLHWIQLGPQDHQIPLSLNIYSFIFQNS